MRCCYCSLLRAAVIITVLRGKFLFRRDVVFGGREFSVWGVTDGESNNDNKRKVGRNKHNGGGCEKFSSMYKENLKTYCNYYMVCRNKRING